MKKRKKQRKKQKFDLDEKILFKSLKDMNRIKTKKKHKRKKNNKNFLSFRYFIIILIFLFIIIILFSLVKKLRFNNLSLYSKDEIIKPYIIAQKDFCENFNKYKNEKYENELILTNAKINELNFQLYIFKDPGFLMIVFNQEGAFETTISKNIIEALKFYSSKKKIKNNKDIFILDIGTNIGWYPSLLGRYNYTILYFEAFEKNSYVSKKNYCYLNKESNVIIINKGLGSKEKKCSYFTHLNNAGNGLVLCDNNGTIKDKSTSRYFIKDSEVEITTLNTFMPYLSNKNIVLIKIDIQGNELEALKGGKELITKYHVPFVVLEFTPELLNAIGSDQRELIHLFVDNGYKISLKSFLSKEFLNINEFFIRAKSQVYCYFVHESIIS